MAVHSVVEFVGLPGVGKSTLSHRIAERFAASGGRVRQPARRFAHERGQASRRLLKGLVVLRHFLAHPRESMRAVRAIAATRQPDPRTRLLVTLNWLFVLALTRRSRRLPGLHLLDQGVLQAVWSVALDGDMDRALALLDGLRPGVELPDVVVVVEAALPTVHGRILGRPSRDSRLDRDEQRAPDLLERGREILARIRQRLAALPRPLVVAATNENDGDLDRLAGEVLAAIVTPAPPGVRAEAVADRGAAPAADRRAGSPQGDRC